MRVAKNFPMPTTAPQPVADKFPFPIYMTTAGVNPYSVAVACAITQKENNNMETNNMESTQRRYMDSRLWSIKPDHEFKLLDQFNMREPSWPTSAKDLVERITSGKFTIKSKIPAYEDDEIDAECYGSDIFRKIDWRDPNGPQPNKDGYQAGLAALNKAMGQLKDSIQLQPIEKAVAEFEAFKNWTYVQ